MKTLCNTCRKVSINFIFKKTGTVYCSACGNIMQLSLNIVNAMSAKNMFLPDNFFDIAEPERDNSRPQPQLQQLQRPAKQQPQMLKTAAEAAAERRTYGASHSRSDPEKGGVIKFPTITREEAAQRRASSLAQAELLAAQAGGVTMAERSWFAAKPDLAGDMARGGVDMKEGDLSGHD